MTQSRSVLASDLTIDSILATEELAQRRARPPDYATENRALLKLTEAMARSPQTILHELAQVALEACRADSAGLALVEAAGGEEVLRWEAAAGAFARYLGTTVPREASFCEAVMQRNAPQLMRNPASYYTYLQRLCRPVVEMLLVPFYRDDVAVGTLWVIAHTNERHFDAEDARLLTSLSRLAAAGVRMRTLIEDARQAEDRERRLATAAATANARFRAVFDQAPIYAGILSVDGILLDINQLALESCGYHREDVIGRPFWETGWWHGSKEVQEKVRAGAQWALTGEPYQEVLPYFFADGTERVTDFALHPIFDDAGQVAFLFHTGMDITERVEAEESLRESEARHRFLASLADATQPLTVPNELMASTARLLGEHLNVNRCAYADVEADGDQFTIRYDWTRDVPSAVGTYSLDAFGQRVATELRAGRILIIRDVERELDVDERQALLNLSIRAIICCPLVKGGRIVAMIAVTQAKPRNWKAAEIILVKEVVDRSWAHVERARSEQELAKLFDREREQGRLLAQVAKAALTIHSAPSLESVLRTITEEARRIIGAHQAITCLATDGDDSQPVNAVSLSEKYSDWHGRDVLPSQNGLHAFVCNTNKPVRLTQAELEAHPAFRAVDPEHEETRHPPLRGWLAAPFIGRTGRNLGLIQLSDKLDGEFNANDEAILVQLAHIASVALENARLYEQLREQDRRKDEFLATLAHELRNPLAPMRNGLHLLKIARSRETEEKARELMERQLTQMVRLIDDLLDVSRISRGKIILKKERISIADVVQSALEACLPHIEAEQHELSVRLPEEPIIVEADSTRLAQVLGNLINNAVKYTPSGGSIEVMAERVGAEVVLSVRDNGLGIPREMQSRVFDLFSQVSRSLDRSQGGLGIGLSLVRSLVELHGGRVTVFSEGVGKGSVFRVMLPIAPPEASTPVESGQVSESVTPPSEHPALRVLIVDDNVDAAESLRMLSQLYGHECRVAHSGSDALDIASQFQPQIVFLDIGLPGLSGYDVARQLRLSMPDVLLVALTGWGTDQDKQRAFDAGFDRHLTKPAEPRQVEQLLAETASQIERRKA